MTEYGFKDFDIELFLIVRRFYSEPLQRQRTKGRKRNAKA